MKNIVLKFGLLSGLATIAMFAVMLPLTMNGTIDFEGSEVIGYSSMILSFLLVFFGIRSYRRKAGGTITFGKAFQVGILITLIACAVYVVTWEIYYFGFDNDFADKYATFAIEKLKKSGASPETIAAETQKMDKFKVMYQNPAFNIGMTFMEIFPVGLVMTLISAAILRRKAPPAPAVAAAV